MVRSWLFESLSAVIATLQEEFQLYIKACRLFSEVVVLCRRSPRLDWLIGSDSKGAGRRFEQSMLDNLPKAGPHRLMPATAIAEAVWAAYQNSDQIHFMCRKKSATQIESRLLIFGRQEKGRAHSWLTGNERPKFKCLYRQREWRYAPPDQT
jgi:hypothetical protein